MDNLQTPNQEVYTALSTIANVASVGVVNQNVFADFPALTYTVVNIDIERDMDNTIAGQTFEVVIDIWTEQSVRATELLVEVEEKMRALDYNLDFSGQVPNPQKDIYHITSRFRKANV